VEDLSQSHCDVNLFGRWQSDYAAHGVATFPVDANKRPMVSRYNRFGLVGSGQIASKFANAPAIGFMCGRRNGITSLDCDSKDERVLADALSRHGQTPVVARTGSGHFQAWYRHNGERRRIRPDRNVPIDILGAGFVVAPPSQSAKGRYEFISGSLDDLDRLPAMQNVPVEAWDNSRLVAEVKQGQRNDKLFSACLEAARHCDDFDALCDVAQTRNSEFLPPLEEGEVMRTAASAWTYETEGRNYVGGMRAVFSVADVLPLMPDPHVTALVLWAKASFKPDCHFWMADGLAEKFGWSVYDLRHARRRAVQMGIFRLIRRAGFKRPAIYGWGVREAEEQGVC
jgi:bifunctional DNA primase/polymerase-like protein/primase-like protein